MLDIGQKKTPPPPQWPWASSWENLFLPVANNKGADQPAHPCSLISTFVAHCLDSIISFYIRNFKPLASFCGWTGQFESYLVANLEDPEDRFFRVAAHLLQINFIDSSYCIYSCKSPLSNKMPSPIFCGTRWPNVTKIGFWTPKFLVFALILSQEQHFENLWLAAPHSLNV